MLITPEQIRAARSLLRLEQAELASRAHVSVVTIRRLEGAGGVHRTSAATIEGVRQALEQAGAEFIPNGVRRRSTLRPQAHFLYEELRAISLRAATRQQGDAVLTEADLYDEDGLPA